MRPTSASDSARDPMMRSMFQVAKPAAVTLRETDSWAIVPWRRPRSASTAGCVDWTPKLMRVTPPAA